MKKIFSIILAALILIGAAGYLYADGFYTRDPSFKIKSEVFAAASGGQISSSIVAGANIIGYTCYDSSAGACGLYDTTTTTLIKAGTGVFAEAGVAAGGTSTVMLPFPRTITSGFGVLATSTGRVTVYYEN
jgi:hypothetical protein